METDPLQLHQLLYDWLADLLKSLTRYSNVRDCLRRPKLTPKGTPDDGYEGLLTYQFVLLKYDGGQNLFSLQTAQYAYVKMSHHIYFTQSRQKKAKNLRKGSRHKVQKETLQWTEPTSLMSLSSKAQYKWNSWL